MTKSKILSLYDKIYYIAIGVLLVSLFKYTFFLIPLYLFYIRKRSYFSVVFIFMSIFSLRVITAKFKPFFMTNHIRGIVTDVNKSSYTIKIWNQSVLYYTKESLEIGDYVNSYGNYREINYPSIPFDYNTYYLRHNIKYQFFPNTEETKKIISIYSIRNFLINFFDKNYNPTISQFYKSLLLGYNDDLEIKDSLSKIGISHMFAISGLHILLFVKLLSFFLKERYINIFLVLYILITGFSPSVIRASLLVILKSFFKYKKYDFSSLDSFSMIFIFLLFLNPNYIYDLGFELSFLISFSIIITDFKNKFKTLQVSLLSFMLSLPLVININNQINVLSPLYNILLIGFFSYIFLPFTIFSVFIKNFKPYIWTCEIFIKFINFLSNINIGNINMPSFTSLETLLYYIGIVFVFRAKKALFLVIILMLVFLNGKLDIRSSVYIFDCGQGDSSLIKSSNKTIMIDCYNKTYEYLIKKGITHLDYLILTHGHNDHSADAIDIYNSNIKVDNLIVSYYDNLTLTKEITNTFSNVLYFKRGSSLDLGNIYIDCLAPFKHDSNENNNSLVLKIKVNNKNYLFMGDYENEEELLKTNYDLSCDVLKVGHHGSINANSYSFIDKCNPSIAVISVGCYNSYHLPSKNVLNYFEKKKIKTHITYRDKTFKYS